MQVNELLQVIKDYHAKLGYDYTYPNMYKRMEHFRQLALAMIAEIIETIDWMPWKPWRTLKDQQENRREAAFEIVDQMFFLAAQWHCLGYKDETFEELFAVKLKENYDRINRKYNHVDGMGHACKEGGDKL